MSKLKLISASKPRLIHRLISVIRRPIIRPIRQKFWRQLPLFWNVHTPGRVTTSIGRVIRGTVGQRVVDTDSSDDCCCTECTCPSDCTACPSSITTVGTGGGSPGCCDSINNTLVMTQFSPCYWTATGVVGGNAISAVLQCNDPSACGVGAWWTLALGMIGFGGCGGKAVSYIGCKPVSCPCPPLGTWTLVLQVGSVCDSTASSTMTAVLS